jgi:hypothetical protein
VADCAVAQQQVGSHTHAAPRRRKTGGRHAISEPKGRAIVGGISDGDDIVIRSRDHPTSLWWCGMCLLLRVLPIPLPTMSDQLAITFLLGALDLRQTARSRIMCVAVVSLPALPSLPAVAHHDAQTCFSRWHAR